ncbi:hypothetical protein FRX31_005520 [Thalictrum thalictroides]|uniref:Uncharacterized protein n=1 Tax=Thalictrum thalictroides TaxID=46969 RepID=A0A7J6X668_THATH|nr:hypothetical protein FRX31_005520 [Thalictrum thalictroides]
MLFLKADYLDNRRPGGYGPVMSKRSAGPRLPLAVEISSKNRKKEKLTPPRRNCRGHQTHTIQISPSLSPGLVCAESPLNVTPSSAPFRDQHFQNHHVPLPLGQPPFPPAVCQVDISETVGPAATGPGGKNDGRHENPRNPRQYHRTPAI